MADKKIKVEITGNADSAVLAFNRLKTESSAALKEVNSTFSSLTSTLGGIPGIVGIVSSAMAGGAFKESIGTLKEVGAEVLKLTKVFGVTAEEASVLRVALDDAFLTVDEAVGASDRLTRSALKNSEAFKAVGIEIKNQDGSLKSSLDIMMEVNDYLKTLTEGKNRDSAAMALYGKGWREFSGILKLTSEGLQDAKQRAEELHLVFGDDKLKGIKAYKSAMKDIDDVAESLKVQLGTSLLPQITRFGVVMSDVLLKGIDPFITGITNTQAELIRMAMLVDKAGGTLTTMGGVMAKIGWLGWGGPIVGENGPAKIFGGAADWFDEKNGIFAGRYKESESELQKLANVAAGLNPDGSKPKPSVRQNYGNLFDPDSLKPGGTKQAGTKTDSKFFGQAWDTASEELIMDSGLKPVKDTSGNRFNTMAPFSILGPGGASAWLAQAQSDRELKRQFTNEELLFDFQLHQAERERDIEEHRMAEEAKFNITMNSLSAAGSFVDAFNTITNNKHRAAFRILQGVKSGETIVSTYSAVMKAWDDPQESSYYGRAVKAAAVLATGISAVSKIWSASPSGGGTISGISTNLGGSANIYGPGGQVVTQPTNGSNIQPLQITVHIEGNVISDDGWIEGKLAPTIRDLVQRRNVDFGMVAA